MNTSFTTTASLAVAFGLFTGSVSADYLFSFGGTITTDNGATGHTGSAFTINMFVQDLAADLTPVSNMGSYRISTVQMDIGSDNIIEESFSPNQLTEALYIDAGLTQLVGAFDIAPGGFATYLFGVNIPTNAFANPHSLFGQGNMMLTGLASSSYSFYNSAGFDFILNLDSFTFDNNVAVVPLPSAGIAGLGLLIGLGIYGKTKR